MEKKQGTLVRTLGLSTAILLVISSVIGSGVYKKVAPMSSGLLSPDLVLWAWLLAGVVSLTGALSNAEIASMIADSGGEYVYFKRIYGRFTAFIYGWSVFTAIKTAAVSAIAYVFAGSVNSLIALPHLPDAIENIKVLGLFMPFDDFGVKVLTIALIIVLTFINTRSLKLGAFLSSGITWFVVVGLALVVLSGLTMGGGDISNIQTASQTQAPITGFALVQALFAAMLAAFWGYEGWNTVGFLGGEIKNPNKNLPLALSIGLFIIIGVYLLVNFTYLYILPIDKIIAIQQAGNKIAAVEVVRHFAGDMGAFVLSMLILVTTLGCTNSTILMPPRIYQAMAHDGLFFKSAKNINPNTHTPNSALWIQCVWACLLVLSGSFDQLTDMLIFAAFFFYGATAFGVFVLRVREPQADRPYRVWGYPIVPAIFVLFCITLIILTCINAPREAGIGLFLMATGVPFYFYWNKNTPPSVGG